MADSARLIVPTRLGAREEASGRGGMFVSGGRFDKSAIPDDPTQRILRVPIPPDSSGRPAYDRDMLWPDVRAKMKEEHEAKVRKNLIERDRLLTLCHGDMKARRDVEALCAQDPVFWIEHFVWVTDPRLGEKATMDPFVLYDTQRREVEFFANDFLVADEMLLLVEKSRAWGATWLYGSLASWGFIYRKNWQVLLGAPNQDDVDKGGLESDHQSIFGKLRYLLKRLPPWQVPGDLLTNSKFNKNFLIKHPLNDNALHGRQYCDNWGRSLRFLWTFGDEAAHSIHFRGASVNYGNTSNRNIALSSHKGGGTEFARMVNEVKEDPSPDRVVHTLFWAENPTLDVEVYWGWRKKYGWEKVAQERDIDQQGSVGFAIYQDFDPSFHVVTKRERLTDPATGDVLVEPREEMDYDPDLPLGLLVDPGGGPDPWALIWWQPHRANREIRLVDFIQYSDKPGPFFVPFILGYSPEETLDKVPWAERYEYDEDEKRIIERHRRWGAIDAAISFGDCYGASKAASMASGLQVYETWERYGCAPVYPVKIKNKEDAILRVAAALGRIRIAGRLLHQRTQSRATPTLVECFKQYAWVVRESPDGLPLPRVPKHDRYCHAMDCVQFLMQYEEGDDPSLTPLAPLDARGPAKKGRAMFMRTTRDPNAGESYETDDSPITRG